MADNLNTSFFERRLKLVIQLYKGEFEDGSNTKEITDLAMTCQIQKLAAPSPPKASRRIPARISGEWSMASRAPDGDGRKWTEPIT